MRLSGTNSGTRKLWFRPLRTCRAFLFFFLEIRILRDAVTTGEVHSNARPELDVCVAWVILWCVREKCNSDVMIKWCIAVDACIGSFIYYCCGRSFILKRVYTNARFGYGFDEIFYSDETLWWNKVSELVLTVFGMLVLWDISMDVTFWTWNRESNI